MDLYRVGKPRVSECLLSRWEYHRGTGGLGTGVYAFRTQQGAEANIESARHDKSMYVLSGALSNPVQPTTVGATRSLNALSRQADLLVVLAGKDCLDLDDVRADPGQYRVSLSSAYDDCEKLGHGDYITDHATTVLLHTPELKDEYAMDGEAMVADLLDAAEDARGRCGGRKDRTCVQPINLWLGDDFDGVAPHSSAAGDVGAHGCCIFKRKIDQCVGRETEQFEEIPADKLNECFADDGGK